MTEQKKSVLMVMPHMVGGGAERVAAQIINCMHDKGYDTGFVVTADRKSEVIRCDLKEDIPLILLKEELRPETSLEKFKYLPAKLISKVFCGILEKFGKPVPADLARLSIVWQHHREIRYFREMMLKNPDMKVITFLQPTIPIVLLAAQKLPNRIIISERCDPHRLMAKRYGRRFIEKYYKRADVVVFQTTDAKEVYPKCVSDKGVVISNPVKSGLPMPYTGERNKNITTFCRISLQKNLPVLLEAFAMLNNKHSGYTLRIIGDTVNEEGIAVKGALDERIKELGLEESVCFEPFKSDVHNAILQDAMYVNSSDYEGISNAMLEAMAIGLPVVCTDCPIGGAKATIINGENGMLVPVGDAESMYEAMDRIVSDKALSERLSENAAKLRTELSLEATTEKWIQLFDEQEAGKKESEKKNILIVIHHLTVGGIQKSLITTLRHIDYKKYNVTLYVRKNRLTLINQIVPQVKIIVNNDKKNYYHKPIIMWQLVKKILFKLLNMNNAYKNADKKLIIELRNAMIKTEIKNNFAESHYDVAIGFIQGYASDIIIQGINADRKVMFYGSSIDEAHDFHEWAFKSLDEIVAVSPGVKSLLLKMYDLPDNKVSVVENYVEYDEVKNKSKQINIQKIKDRFVLCSCGRMTREKGFDLAVLTAEILKKEKIPFIWKFIGDGTSRIDIEDMVREKELDKYILFLGMLNNPYPEMAECDIYVQPSYEESYGRTIKEALILGCAVVSTNTIGGELLLKETGRGIVVDTKPEDLAKAIIKLIKSEETLKKYQMSYTQEDAMLEKRIFEEKINSVILGK